MDRRGILEDGPGRPVASQEELIRSAISGWRDSLIDPTPASRLLSTGPAGADVIEVRRPEADDILARLRAGGSFAFRSLPPGPATALPPPAPYILDTVVDPDGLDVALRGLMRRSGQEYLDRGGAALYLTFGALTWVGAAGTRFASPLLLVPVRLVAGGPRQPPMLEPSEEDPVVNPALILALSRRGITFPRVNDPAEVTVSALAGAVRAAAEGEPSWQVSESVLLSCFSFAGEEMYRDLLDHEDIVAAHPTVAALAAAATPGSGPGPVPEAGAGRGGGAGRGARERADAEVPPLVLDADSSQRACVTAALGGASFVINGPPGTGKSQTIANMIGAFLQAGRTVLLVSAKAAALDVVAGRLAGAGLGGYLLELHSHTAARPAVALSLAGALAEASAPPSASPGPAPRVAVDAARRRREQLRGYASALNRPRHPLEHSLRDVLAMLASLDGVPAAPATGRAPVELTMGVLADVRGGAADLAAAWRPAAEGPSFAWRGLTERGPLDSRLYEAASALEGLAAAVRVNQTLAEATGLTRPSSARVLAGLLDHLLMWPEDLPDSWLTADTLDAADAAVAQLAAALTAIAAREEQASHAAGMPWPGIPAPDALPVVDAGALAELTPACADVSDLSAGEITALAQAFSAGADMLERRLETLSSLAGMLGIRPPASFGQANDVMVLARLAGEPDRPEAAWLSVAGHRAASTAAHVLVRAHRALAAAEAGATAYFTPDALLQDLEGLAQRFASDHHRLGRLSGEYRADKRTVAALARDGIDGDTALEHLGLAVAWQRAVRALTAAEIGHARILGRYYLGAATDFERLGRALAHAGTAVRCSRGQDLSRAAGHIASGAIPQPVITATMAEIRQDLSAWQATLAPSPVAAARPELLNGTIAEAAGWLRAHLDPLQAEAGLTRAVSEATGRQLTFGQARHLVSLREAADSAHAQLTARDSVFRELCGQPYAGRATDLVALRDGLEWARRLRTLMTGGPGPLTPAHLNAAESAVPTDRLGKAADAWQVSAAALLAAFAPDRQPELAEELDDFSRGNDLLEAMFNDTTGPGEWRAHQAARAVLAAHGLDTAVDFCVAERLQSGQVPAAIERALLQEWADYQIRTDPALAPLRAVGRDAMVDGFQQLEEALAAAAAQEIAGVCDARRSRGTGEAAIGRHEQALDGHLPVRELLARAGPVVQELMPCFLMSPLTVSRYLPAGLRFDVVIIDEASQLSAAGAVTSIYRGDSLILAGDDRQVPPAGRIGARSCGETPPGNAAGGAGREWPAESGEHSRPVSVLDLAKASGAFPEFSLRWHYRSQHEALIAFPNAAIYEGRLLTLPGRRPDGPDPGVGLLPGEGTYRRGSSQDNPAEAARVAQRVIHHFSTRPGLSLGVVTFTEAQAAAIDRSLTQARKQRPDLDPFFTSERLRGFFVKTADAAAGDERDVVILSTCYGPDEDGQLTTDFVPLAGQAGWRRLNVAITRARHRIEIVTSIQAADIPDAFASDGLRQLRRYLDHAAHHLAPGRG